MNRDCAILSATWQDIDDILARDPNHLGATLFRQFAADESAATLGN